VDLTAVNNLATAATASQASFNALAADYGDSCVRRTVYEHIGSAMEQYIPRPAATAAVQRVAPASTAVPPPGVTLSVTDAATLPASEIARRLTLTAAASLPEATYLVLITRRDSAAIMRQLPPATLNALDNSPGAMAGTAESGACIDEQAASHAWQEANAVVVGYFIALGKLAGGTGSDDTYGLKVLGNDVAATKAIPAARASAIASFANDALTQIYNAKRRGALAQFIPKADASLGNAIKMLDAFGTDDYAHALSRERIVANRFFQRNLRLAKPGVPAFQILGYADTWGDRMKTLDARSAAIQSYVRSWETLRVGHANLLTSIDRNDPGAAFAVAQSIYSAMAPDITAINKAYAGGK
jgi:hypothetical protein